MNGAQVYEYMTAGVKNLPYFRFDNQKYDEFSLRISVLSGYVAIGYYTDKELTQKMPIDPFKYMNSEYIFEANQISQFAASGLLHGHRDLGKLDNPLKVNFKDVIGQKNNYELELDSSELKRINAVEKEGIIIVNLKAEQSADEEKKDGLDFKLIAVEFVNNNKVLYLREDRPLEEKLQAGSMKLYKYINSDPNVKEIRIHVN